jgi:hypothetical protein
MAVLGRNNKVYVRLCNENLAKIVGLYALYLRKTPSLITQKKALYFLATTSASNFKYLRNERLLL